MFYKKILYTDTFFYIKDLFKNIFPFEENIYLTYIYLRK